MSEKDLFILKLSGPSLTLLRNIWMEIKTEEATSTGEILGW